MTDLPMDQALTLEDDDTRGCDDLGRPTSVSMKAIPEPTRWY